MFDLCVSRAMGELFDQLLVSDCHRGYVVCAGAMLMLVVGFGEDSQGCYTCLGNGRGSCLRVELMFWNDDRCGKQICRELVWCPTHMNKLRKSEPYAIEPFNHDEPSLF